MKKDERWTPLFDLWHCRSDQTTGTSCKRQAESNLLIGYDNISESDWESQWVDLREHLQETIDFPMKYIGFSCIFSCENQSIGKGNRAYTFQLPTKNCQYMPILQLYTNDHQRTLCSPLLEPLTWWSNGSPSARDVQSLWRARWALQICTSSATTVSPPTRWCPSEANRELLVGL